MVALLLAVLALAACGGNGHDDDRGRATEPARPLPAPEPSTIAVTFRLDERHLARVLDSIVPRMASAKTRWTWLDRIGVRYAWARGPVEVDFRGDTILFAADVDYQLRLCYRVTSAACWPPVDCGWSPTRFRPPALRARLAMRTHVRLQPDWRLATRTGPLGDGVAYDARNRCRLSVARLDATPYLAREVRAAMDSIGREVDRWLAHRADFRREAERLWALAQRPLDLGGGVWLVIDPRAAHAEPVGVGAGGALAASVALEAYPYAVVGERPELTAPLVPLPPLEWREVPDSLHVALPVRARFAALNALLEASVVGDTVASVAGRYVVRSIAAEPAGRRVRITAEVDGIVDGRLVLVGTPTYDPRTRRLALPDLDYAFATRNLLARLGNAVAYGGLRRRLQEATAWDLGPQIDTTRARLDAWLNQPLAPGIRARGGIAGLRFVGLRVEGEEVRVLLVADGVATIELEPATIR